MGNTFLSATANYDDFISRASGEINSHVQKNNEAGLKKTFSFFQGDNKILILSGFAGVGKKQVAEHTLSYLDKDTITLKFVCTESSKLDDVHLWFYKTLQKKTSIKTAELDAISAINEKIEYIISNSNLKFVPVFFGFDYLKEEDKKDILNYIYSLSQKDNVKTVIISKVFDTDVIPEELKYTKVMIKALSKEIFEAYIKEFGIKITPAMIDQLYRLSRGYFYSACISAKIMINQEYSINDFIVEYTNSGLKFDDFLAKTYYRLIVGTTKSAFNLFVKLRHGLNLKILQTIGSYPEVILKTLSTNYYIYKKQDLYYPLEFLKQQLEPEIGDEISKKRLASYYEKQIELPPEERDFTVSRAALQEEVAYYKGLDIEPPKEEAVQETKEENVPEEQKKDPKKEYENMPTKELLDNACEKFSQFNYLETLDILTVALSRKESLLGSNMLYTVYSMLAQTYEKLNKWQYALYYYEVLENHFQKLDDTKTVEMLKYEKANIYYQSYRIIESIKELKLLVATSKDSTVLARSHILLGNIALAASNKELALQYFKDGIKYVEDNTPVDVKMELFFKFASLSDEINDINNAIEYYQRCIKIDDGKNKYGALAYSNLADLFYDNDLTDEAKECFEKAYEFEKRNKNDYGIYYTLSKLIDLSDRKNLEKLLQMAQEAKDSAKRTQDFNAIVESTIKLGDIYYDMPEPEKALSQYLELFTMTDEVFPEHNIKVIKSRLEDIRARIGKDRFEELVPGYEKD